MRRWGSRLRANTAVLVAGVGLLVGPALLTDSVARADAAPLVSESFETTATALPTGWEFAEFSSGVSQASIVTAAAPDAAADGARYLEIVSPKDNHARVELPTTVTANTMYRFHAMVRSAGAKSGAAAAVLGVADQTSTSTSVTSDAWTAVDLYVQSGAKTSITFTLGLGNYGQVNHGRADFDAVTLTPVDAAPAGASPLALPGAPGAGAPGVTALGENMHLPLPNHVVYPLAGLLVVLVAGAGIYLARRPEEPEASVSQS